MAVTKKDQNAKLVINLNQKITGLDDTPLLGHDFTGAVVEFDIRLALQWAINSIPPEQHTKYEVMQGVHSLIPQLKKTSDQMIIDDPETHKFVKDIVLNCKNLNSIAKDYTLTIFKAF